MQFKRLLDDESAVSPVIGVILMVAITVILAAVIATFVLGLGDTLSDTSPQATFGTNFDSTNSELTITHESGQSLSSDNLRIRGTDGGADDGIWTDVAGADDSTGTISAGDSITVAATDGDTVRLVWESPEGSTTSTLLTWPRN